MCRARLDGSVGAMLTALIGHQTGGQRKEDGVKALSSNAKIRPFPPRFSRLFATILARQLADFNSKPPINLLSEMGAWAPKFISSNRLDFIRAV